MGTSIAVEAGEVVFCPDRSITVALMFVSVFSPMCCEYCVDADR